MDSWIPAYRKMFEPDHWLAPTKAHPASRRDAWLDLCQMATWQPRETRTSGTLQRGELVASLRTLGKRWGWCKDAVFHFCRDLLHRTAIATVRQTPDGTVYRIVNYDTYAVGGEGDTDRQTDSGTDRGQTEDRQEQEVKKERSTSRGVEIPLPGDWKPTDPHRQRAVELGVDVDREAERFRAHAESHDRRAVRWNAAFTTWLLKAGDFRGPLTTEAPRFQELRPGVTMIL